MDVLLNLKHIFDIQIINTFLLLITYIPLNVFLFNYTSNISRYFILFFGTSFIFLSFFIIERLLYFKYKIYINYIKNLKLFIIIGLLNSIKDIIYVYYFTNPNINELFLLIPLIPNMITSIFFTKKIILNKRYVNFLQCDIIILLGIFFLITIAYARSVYTNKFQFDNITLINSTIYVIGTIIETISNLLIEKLNENIGLQQEQQLYDKYNSNFFEKKYNYVFIVLNTVAYEFIFISLLFWVNLIPPFGRSLDLINFWNHLTQSIFFIDYKIIIYILSIITFIYFQT